MNDGTKRPTAIWVVSVFLAAGSLIHSMNTARADARSIEVNATAAQRVHPVLIRNEHSALMRLTVQVKQQDVKATSFAFSLRGTDDKNDIESLQMFYTGDQGEFSPRSSFGDPAKPADNPTFCGNQKLQPGANVFWLSCRLDPTADLSHQVDAVCTSIRTSAGNVTPSDDTPGVRKRIGIALRKHNDGGGRGYPSISRIDDGHIGIVYEGSQADLVFERFSLEELLRR